MKTWEEMSYKEKREVTDLFGAWLHGYTHEIVTHVLSQRDEILANDFAMGLIRELVSRKEEERKRYESDFYFYMDRKKASEIMYSHTLTHSDSYHDILDDMYIKEWWTAKCKAEREAEENKES